MRLRELIVDPEDEETFEIAERFTDQPIRPSLLNDIEAGVHRHLLESGYSCAVVTTRAHDETVTVRTVSGAQRSFGELDIEAIEGLRNEALVRFRPFQAQTPYDIRLLELYEKRLEREGLVQGTYFQENCKESLSPVRQSFLLGPPRTLRFGVGIDTENGPLAQMSWRHHRFSQMGSQINFTLQASLNEQSALGRSELYLWSHAPRFALMPQVRLLRVRSDNIIDISSSFELRGGRSWDSKKTRWFLSAGPAFVTNWYETRATRFYQRESSLALLIQAEMRSHAYELFDSHPQDGTLVSLLTEHRDPNLGFPDRTFKASGSIRWIRPFSYCGKGRCVAALRSSLSNTWTSAQTLDALPPSLKTYLGGFENLRGFGVRSLPDNAGLGALSAIATGLEVRGVDIWIRNWEPYLFSDAGVYGLRSARWDSPIYSSLGLGLRWSSPIGLIQGYVARSSLHAFYAFASFGGEF
jgi:outer membrane translocation and assembly module TamA